MRTHLKVHKITSESRTKQIQTEEKTSQKIKIWPNDVTGQRTLYELITLANRIQFTLFSLSICVFLFQVRCAFQGCFTKECLHDWLNYASSCSLCINLLLSLVDFVCACACVCTFNWRLYPSPLLIFAMFFFSRSLFFQHSPNEMCSIIFYANGINLIMLHVVLWNILLWAVALYAVGVFVGAQFELRAYLDIVVTVTKPC